MRETLARFSVPYFSSFYKRVVSALSKWSPHTPRQFNHAAPLTPDQWILLNENVYARFAPNPHIANYVLLQRDSKISDSAIVSEFSFQPLAIMKDWVSVVKTNLDGEDEDVPILIPSIQSTPQLQASENAAGEIVLHGKTKDNIRLIGKPLCEIDFTPKYGSSQQYVYYSIMPDTRPQPVPIRIPRLTSSPDAQQLQREKGGRYKEDDLKIVNSDVPERMAITRRIPNQNQVMEFLAFESQRKKLVNKHRKVNRYVHDSEEQAPENTKIIRRNPSQAALTKSRREAVARQTEGWRAIDEYWCCAQEYKPHLNPLLAKMFEHSAEIMHLSTLMAMERHGVEVDAKTEQIARKYRLLRTEWLHLLAWSLHPMNEDPQQPGNLGAARACDNTRMILLEYTARWFALNSLSSHNQLISRFDLFLDTQVIDMITLMVLHEANGTKFKLTQKIDALMIQPEHIHGSDLAGLIALLHFLMNNVAPTSKQVVKIHPSVSAVSRSNPRFFVNKTAEEKRDITYYPIGHQKP